MQEPDGHREIVEWERLAEQSYSAMYDAPPLSCTKDAYDNACFQLARAIEAEQKHGLEAEAARLIRRRDHIMAVYDSQFRGF